VIIPRWIILRMRDVLPKSCRENQNRLFLFSIFLRKSCRLWDNVEKYCGARQATYDSIIWRMRFTCWITKATDTHSEPIILIAFPRQQWLRERASMLRYAYIACVAIGNKSQCCVTSYLPDTVLSKLSWNISIYSTGYSGQNVSGRQWNGVQSQSTTKCVV
jgi:hypothetical protein